MRLLRRLIWLRRLRKLERLTQAQLKMAWMAMRAMKRTSELENTPGSERSLETSLLLMPLPMKLDREQERTWEEMQLATSQLITVLQSNRYTKE